MKTSNKIAQLIIARLDGGDLTRRFKYYLSLVEKGIGGFIVFGGRVKDVRDAIRELQDRAEIPLFVASDLEQGLGQQLEGGTIFPPAMAVARAISQGNREDLRLLRSSIEIIAREARTVGINTILAPVVDVNTNPRNPIICTRAFSEDPEVVAWFGKEFIRGFQRHGLFACAKHFPGHGDTSRDSHRELPIVRAGRERLRVVELYPFNVAVKTGARMIMVGHLKVPVLDPEFPASISQRVIKGLLREEMGFQGLVITDAMNMQGIISTGLSDGEACLMSLKAGVDLLLHPSRPEEVIDYLTERSVEVAPEVERAFEKVLRFKRGLRNVSSPLNIRQIGRRANWKVAKRLTEQSIDIDKPGKSFELSSNKRIALLIIDDDNNLSGRPFIKAFRRYYRKVKVLYVDNRAGDDLETVLASISSLPLVVAVFSRVSAWKGRSSLSNRLKAFLGEAVKKADCSIVTGFCCPYILRGLKADIVVRAYSDTEQVQETVAGMICRRLIRQCREQGQ